MKCPGVKNPITGCKTKEKCIPKGEHQWGETPGTECPGWCPAICNDDEILCPSYTDPCNGCPTEEICRQAIKNVNGVFCPGKEYTIRVEGEDYRENKNRRGGFLSATHNCPVYCKEWQGEVQCPVYEDVLGCKPEALCVVRQIKSEVNGTRNIALPLLYAQNSAQLENIYVNTQKMTKKAATTKIFAKLSLKITLALLVPTLHVHLVAHMNKTNKIMESTKKVAHYPQLVYKNGIKFTLKY